LSVALFVAETFQDSLAARPTFTAAEADACDAKATMALAKAKMNAKRDIISSTDLAHKWRPNFLEPRTKRSSITTAKRN